MFFDNYDRIIKAGKLGILEFELKSIYEESLKWEE